MTAENTYLCGPTRYTRRCVQCRDSGVYKHRGGAAKLEQQTHCSLGHAIKGGNAYRDGGRLRCRTCVRAADEARAERKRLATHAGVTSLTEFAALAKTPGTPGAHHWDYMPWEEDDRAWYVVAHHPGGLMLEEVGALLGITRERVRQIEASALRKLRGSLVEDGRMVELLLSLADLDTLRDRKQSALG